MRNNYSLSHLADGTLRRNLSGLVTRDCTTNAELLAHVAEFDARRLYLQDAYPSMYAYCVHELHMSDDVAYKRIQAARAARDFPVIFEFVADGRLHLSAVVMLRPKLNSENADELLAAATHKTKVEIEQLLAQRFPQPDVPTRIQAIASRPTLSSPSPLSPTPLPTLLEPRQGQAATEKSTMECRSLLLHDVHGSATEQAPGPVETMTSRPKVTPLAPQRFALQVTIAQSTREKLRYAQELMSHRLPSGDIAEVLDRALDVLIQKLEKRKFGATGKPRTSRRRSAEETRYVPSHVRRAVWKRDGGRCTYVSATGQRCPARKLLEFDHLDEVARGGRATVGNLRLRCRAHNQFAAECAFGAEFMIQKRRARADAMAAARESGRNVVP